MFHRISLGRRLEVAPGVVYVYDGDLPACHRTHSCGVLEHISIIVDSVLRFVHSLPLCAHLREASKTASNVAFRSGSSSIGSTAAKFEALRNIILIIRSYYSFKL